MSDHDGGTLMREAGASADPVPSAGAGDRPTVRDTAIALTVFLLARALSAVFLLLAAPAQVALTDSPDHHVEGSLPASPGYWDVVTNWDGQWYETIATHGYRTDPALFGPPAQRNEMAFFPVYPMLCRGVMAVTGASFGVAASLVSLVAGALAVVLLARWLVRTRGRLVAHLAVAGLAVFPTAVVFQTAYTESLALLLLVVVLTALAGRRWAVLWGALLVLGLTRPVLAPVALYLLVLAWRAHRAPAGDERRADVRPLLVSVGVAGLATAAWPVTVAVLTGIPTAFTDTMAAWVKAGGLRGGWVAGIWQLVGPAAALALVLVGGALAWVRSRRPRPDRPADGLGTWGPLYLGYVLLTTTINPSILRYSLLTLVPAEPTRRAVTAPLARFGTRGVVVAAGAVLLVEVLLQWWWVRALWVIPGAPVLPP
ncbi:hypothetical protein [Phycicoccus sp.]|uniref:hypothetical protein n=1 Tax=Phycicoccus sp. TaxID=1902410 RepID=UPI002C0382D8|nr:hypothetical protein [Phycicoccus sp.]HMM95760.1 hypothetical protein [Phycicoccus sp.]